MKCKKTDGLVNIMNKIIYTLLLLLFLVACSDKATIKIINRAETNLTIKADGCSYLLNENESIEEEYYLNSYFFYGDKQKILVEYVEHPYLTPKKYIVRLKPGDSKTINVNLDRAIFHLANFSFGEIIMDVHYKKIDEEVWSEDVLDEILFSEGFTYIPFPAGDFQVKFVLTDGEEVVREISFTVGETTYYNYGI